MTVISTSESQLSNQAQSSQQTACEFTLVAQVMVKNQWLDAGGVDRFSQTPATINPQLQTNWQHDGSLLGSSVSRSDGKPLNAQKLRIIISLPLLNFARVVIPDCGRHYINASKSLDIRAAQFRINAANAGHPFFAVTDEGGAFLFAFGVLNAPFDVEMRRRLPHISTRKAMVGGDELLCIEFEWETNSQASTVEVATYLAQANQQAGDQDPGITHALRTKRTMRTWFDALREYTGNIIARDQIQYPKNPAAWDPTWCTWTAFPSDEMTSQRCIDSARFAKEAGVGTIILDDGWFGPGLDAEPEEFNIGDYEPDVTKFPDLADTIAQIQAMGLRVLLWHAPLCMATTSKTFGRLKQFAMKYEGKEYLSTNQLAQLCPACPEVRQYVIEETKRLLSQYNADGLKVDLFNCLPQGRCESCDHTHDYKNSLEALDVLMGQLWNAARSVRPDVLLELKQDYGNVRLARHGTMVRAGDTAYDSDTNLLRAGYTQAFAQCVHNDYLVTSIHTRPKMMTLLMIKALAAGVPTLGLDLERMGPELRRVIGRWLGFYNDNRDLFTRPRRPQNNEMNVWQGGSNQHAWVAAVTTAHTIELPDAPRVTLINGTGRTELYLQLDAPTQASWVVFNDQLEEMNSSKGELLPNSSVSIPSGGMIEITLK